MTTKIDAYKRLVSNWGMFRTASHIARLNDSSLRIAKRFERGSLYRISFAREIKARRNAWDAICNS